MLVSYFSTHNADYFNFIISNDPNDIPKDCIVEPDAFNLLTCSVSTYTRIKLDKTTNLAIGPAFRVWKLRGFFSERPWSTLEWNYRRIRHRRRAKFSNPRDARCFLKREQRFALDALKGSIPWEIRKVSKCVEIGRYWFPSRYASKKWTKSGTAQ